MLREPVRLGELVVAVAGAYGVDPEDIGRQVEGALEDLVHSGLVDEVGP